MSDLTDSTILIVERRIDHFIVALQQALEDGGAETIVVRDFDHAVELMDKLEFNAVVMGVLTPETPDALLERIVSSPTVFYAPDTSVAAVVQSVVDLRK